MRLGAPAPELAVLSRAADDLVEATIFAGGVAILACVAKPVFPRLSGILFRGAKAVFGQAADAYLRARGMR